MATATYQTIKLSKGKHSSPAQGACVMELASMLAGEPFTDHPACACPVIASLLRSYNDFIDDRRRQSLYAYASLVVGSRGSSAVQNARAERLREWVGEIERRRSRRFFRPRPLLAPTGASELDPLGARAVQAIRSRNDEMHAEVLSLLDELLAMGKRGAVGQVQAPDRGDAAACARAAMRDQRRAVAPPTTSAIAAPSIAPATTSLG